MKQPASSDGLKCSFCGKHKDLVRKLISSAGDNPRAYICNECISFCNIILADEAAANDRPVRYSAIGAQPVGRPEPSEYAATHSPEISLVRGHDVIAALEEQPIHTLALLSDLSARQANYRYAPGKWTIKEVLGHIMDTERVWTYRALRFARHDATPLPGFEQDDYVHHGGFTECPLAFVTEQFSTVRNATIFLFTGLAQDAWMRRGIANRSEISVRAIAYLIAGHELHHRQVLQEKYLATKRM